MITKSIRLWFGVTKTIPSAQMYIDRFASLQVTLKDQNKKLQQLKNQQRLALEAQQMNIPDHINKLISKLTGSRFEPKAIKNQREELVHYRQYLESLIQQSDKKWQKPRQEIIKLRKQMSQQFLSKFVKLEQNLMKNCSYQTSPELAEGLALIHRLLVNTLQKHGVIFYEPNIGDAFSADLYDTADKGTVGQKIKQVVSRGWKINQKVIKKPIVKLE